MDSCENAARIAATEAREKRTKPPSALLSMGLTGFQKTVRTCVIPCHRCELTRPVLVQASLYSVSNAILTFGLNGDCSRSYGNHDLAPSGFGGRG